MLGLVFTEFVDMVDELYSPTVTEEILIAVKPASGGAYTAYGSYDQDELAQLAAALAARLGVSETDVLCSLGNFLVSSLAERYSSHFRGSSDPFAFLSVTCCRLQNEARKLYPEADLPEFVAHSPNSETLVLECDASGCVGSVLLGGVTGVLEYFETQADVVRETIEIGDRPCQRFIIRRRQTIAA